MGLFDYGCSGGGVLFSSNSFTTGALTTSQPTVTGQLRHVHISTSDAPVWIAVGPDGTVATQGSNNEFLLPADRMICLTTNTGQTTVALIEKFPNLMNAHASASVAQFG